MPPLWVDQIRRKLGLSVSAPSIQIAVFYHRAVNTAHARLLSCAWCDWHVGFDAGRVQCLSVVAGTLVASQPSRDVV